MIELYVRCTILFKLSYINIIAGMYVQMLLGPFVM